MARTIERVPGPTAPLRRPGPAQHVDPRPRKRLYLINPANPMVSMLNFRESLWNRFRVWKPLGLMVIAGLTPDDWETTIIDENLGPRDYGNLPRPDLVGLTAFTSQAVRAYELATSFRRVGVPVVIGGIHATMCTDEASRYADAVVTGEAETVWLRVLEDVRHGRLEPVYDGGLADMTETVPARHDLLRGQYPVGAIQTTRGCPLRCSFCSVTSFNGARFRQRPIDQIIEEFRQISEDVVLIVDDNLIGTRRDHVSRAKDLFRAMIQARLGKKWIAQATINVANDDKLLALAAEAGCRGLFIGFESPRPEGLKALSGKHNLCTCHDLGAAVRRIRAHGILVAGSFIIGLENDEPGIGKLIARTAERIGVDLVNVLFLTPLPGTRLWEELEAQERISLGAFPEDWGYFTLTYPVARFAGLTRNGAIDEMLACSREFYAIPRVLRRLHRCLRNGQSLWMAVVGNLSYRRNSGLDRLRLLDFRSRREAASPDAGGSAVEAGEEAALLFLSRRRAASAGRHW